MSCHWKLPQFCERDCLASSIMQYFFPVRLAAETKDNTTSTGDSRAISYNYSQIVALVANFNVCQCIERALAVDSCVICAGLHVEVSNALCEVFVCVEHRQRPFHTVYRVRECHGDDTACQDGASLTSHWFCEEVAMHFEGVRQHNALLLAEVPRGSNLQPFHVQVVESRATAREKDLRHA